VTSTAPDRSLARLLAILAIAGHGVALLAYALAPFLVVPTPVVYLFPAAWVVVLVAALRWLRDHPLRTVLLVLVGAGLAIIVRILGEQYLGWRG